MLNPLRIPCPECDGEGRLSTNGNDPFAGEVTCSYCDGDGEIELECEEIACHSPATHLFHEDSQVFHLCAKHHAEWATAQDDASLGADAQHLRDLP